MHAADRNVQAARPYIVIKCLYITWSGLVTPRIETVTGQTFLILEV